MDENITLLNQVYKNVKMGEETLKTLLPEVKDEQLKQDLEKQKDSYTEFCEKIQKELHNRQAEPKDPGTMNKLFADMGVKMNTMMDKTRSHIADMIIQGSTMGISESTKGLNNCKNTESSVRRLAEDIVSFEQNNIEKMKAYL